MAKTDTVHNILAPGFIALPTRGSVHVYKADDPSVSTSVRPDEVYEASWVLFRDHIDLEELLDLVTLRVERYNDLCADYDKLTKEFEILRKIMGHDTYRAAVEDPAPDKSLSPSDWADWAEKKTDARARAKNHENNLLMHISMLATESDAKTAEAKHAWVLKRYGESRADALYPPGQWEETDAPDEDDEDYLLFEISREASDVLKQEIRRFPDEDDEQFQRRRFAFLHGKYGKNMAEYTLGMRMPGGMRIPAGTSDPAAPDEHTKVNPPAERKFIGVDMAAGSRPIKPRTGNNRGLRLKGVAFDGEDYDTVDRDDQGEANDPDWDHTFQDAAED